MINEQSSINKENTTKMDIKQKSKKEIFYLKRIPLYYLYINNHFHLDSG